MMYLIKIFDGIEDTKGTVIHSPYVNDLKVSSPVVNIVLNSVNDFTFSINVDNPAWVKIKPLVTLVKVIDVRSNTTIFNGRVLKPKGAMSDTGHFSRSVICESTLGYLQDSLQRHMEVRDTTIREFFEIMVSVHNNQVEPHKRFKVGQVTVVNNTDNVYRYLAYESTFASIQDKLIDRLGGYLLVREETDGNYLDYLADVGKDVDEKPIRLTHNMQSMSYEIDPTKVITRLVPLGERIESDDEEAVDASQARLTIESVNNGRDYLDDLELQAEFGLQVKEVTWDDVTLPQRLLTNGRQFLKNQKAASVSYNVNSVNTELLGEEIETFEVGNRYPLINPVLAVNEKIQVIAKRIDIGSPQKSALKIGEKYRTLTEYQLEARRRTSQVVELRNEVDGQRRLIGTLRNEVQGVEVSIVDLKNALGNADIPELENVVEELSRTVDTLTEAIEDLPIYGPVTPTRNGLMTSQDKVKIDGLQNYEPATETVSGLFAADDKMKLNRITVTQLVNLDDIVRRLAELEARN